METNIDPTPLAPDEDSLEVRKPTSLLVAQFFLFPLIIIAICVGIFLLFGYMTWEQRTPREYLNEMRTGSENRRWQAAYEFRNVLVNRKDDVNKSEFLEEVLTMYRDSPPPDIKTRRYLAVILGDMGRREAVPVLLEKLKKEEEFKTAEWPQGWFKPDLGEIRDELVQNQIYTLWALGSIGDNAAVPGIVEQLENGDPTVRKTAAYVLGALNDKRAVYRLQVALNDPKEDVRWNAAMALARLGDAAGADLLVQLLDRAFVDGRAELAPEQRNELVVNAVKCLGLLAHQPAKDRIAALSRNDSSLGVREAAIEALKKF